MDTFPNDKHQNAKKLIVGYCKNIKVDDVDWSRASDPTSDYNCMGYAVGILKWWEPPERGPSGENLTPENYWPPGIAEDITIESFVKAAESEKFTKCDKLDWEEGCEMIVLFHMKQGTRDVFTHAMKYNTPDSCESKLGPDSDIPHKPDAFDGLSFYGDGRIYMKRALSSSRAKE